MQKYRHVFCCNLRYTPDMDLRSREYQVNLTLSFVKINGTFVFDYLDKNGIPRTLPTFQNRFSRVRRNLSGRQVRNFWHIYRNANV